MFKHCFLNENSRSLNMIRFVLLLVLLATIGQAQVPQIISYQGRMIVGGLNHDGPGKFKFALVNTNGNATYWSNDATSSAGGEPVASVALTVTKGLYSVLLGDTTLTNMTAVPSTVFINPDVRLRVWFDDGTHGSQLLTPDQRLAAVGYALMADSVSDGAITSAKLADGSVASAKIATGAIGNAQLAANAVQGQNIATGAVGSAQLASNAVQGQNIATGAVGNAQLAPNAVQAQNIAAGAITNGSLASSALTVAAGSGLGGGGSVSLGGSVTLTNSGVLSLSPGGGITVSGGTGLVTLGSTATNANTAGAIVARDSGGNFSAGTITAALAGNAATATSAGTASTATNFTGPLAGDVTGAQGTTSISAATITGKALTGYSPVTGSITPADSILTAFDKLGGSSALLAPLASPAFTGTVTLPAGTSTAAPLRFSPGTNLTSPLFGAFEFDGTNLFITNNSGSPTRKTLAFTDSIISASQISNGSITSAMLAAGAVGTSQIAAQAVTSTLMAPGAVTDQSVQAGAGINATKLGSGTVTNAQLNQLSTASVTATPSTLVLRDSNGGVAAAPATWIFVDEEPSGTLGGGASAGAWQARALNTMQFTSGAACTLTGGQFTLQPGSSYTIRASAPAYGVTRHKIRLYNVTDSVVVQNGSSEYATNLVQTRSVLTARVQPASAKVYRIEHYCQSANFNYDLGQASSISGTTEVYTIVEITQ